MFDNINLFLNWSNNDNKKFLELTPAVDNLSAVTNGCSLFLGLLYIVFSHILHAISKIKRILSK